MSRGLSMIAAFGLVGAVCTPGLGRTLPPEDECLGTRPSCTVPPAKVVSPHRLHAAWMPAATAWNFDDCALPRATCQIPQAATVTRISTVATTTTTPSVGDLLRTWEADSAARPFFSPRDRDWMVRLNEPRLSAHALEAAIVCLGPVDADRLQQEFTWTASSAAASSPETAVLEAVPAAADVRLFCPRLRVTVHQGHVITLQIGTREGTWRPVALPGPLESQHDSVQLVRFESAIEAMPPSPVPQRLSAVATDAKSLR